MLESVTDLDSLRIEVNVYYRTPLEKTLAYV